MFMKNRQDINIVNVSRGALHRMKNRIIFDDILAGTMCVCVRLRVNKREFQRAARAVKTSGEKYCSRTPVFWPTTMVGGWWWELACVDVWTVELHSNEKLNGNGYKNNNKL